MYRKGLKVAFEHSSCDVLPVIIKIYMPIGVGVSRLMDLLADSREVIRNDVSLHALSIVYVVNTNYTFVPWSQLQVYSDAFCLCLQGLLLLQQLTKSNAAIQKIVAFENAFERLLDIITEEGSSDGGKRHERLQTEWSQLSHYHKITSLQSWS